MKAIPKNRKIRELQKHISFFTGNATRKIHLVNIDFLIDLVAIGLKITGLENRAKRNAENLRIVRHELVFPNLPDNFDGYKILFMSDLHIDGIPDLHQIIAELAAKEEYDLCLMGGDYRLHTRGNTALSTRYLSELIPELKKNSRVIGILGNHDEYGIALELEKFGVDMLVNENETIEKDGQFIYICGVDDANYYAADDFAASRVNVPQDAFSIILSHSPDVYKIAAEHGFSMYLAGHTHGGQICLPGEIPVFCETNAPRRMVHGLWQHENMCGYTSCGAGCSGIPARFNCPPELVLFTLKKT